MSERRQELAPGIRTVGFDSAELSPQDQYKLLTGTVIPRPIALVTTLGPDGPNAAPFSFFNAVCHDPPTVVFSVGPDRRPAGTKDTLRNLRDLPECVVHIVSDAQKERMNVCAVVYPPGVDEIARAGFHTAASVKVGPPRILECPAAMECRVVQTVPVGNIPHHLVIAEVVYFHYHEGIVDARLHVDNVALDAIGRLAGSGMYARIRDHFRMPIPDVGAAP